MKDNSPFFSIVTISYNAERYIERTIKSVLSQGYKNYEYLIIDGASRDNTLSIIDKYKDKITQIISEKDKGLYDGMNKGLLLARGKYIIFMHADDLFYSDDVLEDAYHLLTKKKYPVWLTGASSIIDSKMQVLRIANKKNSSILRMMVSNIINHQATFYRLDIHFQNRYRPFPYALDYDVNLRIWSKYGHPVFTDSIYCYTTMDIHNLSSDMKESWADGLKVLIQYRKENAQHYLIPIDYLIFYLRYFYIKYFIKWIKKIG